MSLGLVLEFALEIALKISLVLPPGGVDLDCLHTEKHNNVTSLFHTFGG